MVLAPGTRLGSYEVLSAIGVGGMGEIYKARDTKLHRDVAVKVLPHVFAADADRLARFEREAQVLAALNHPNIAQVYGLEDSGGMRALVMEIVDGRTLSDIVSAEGGRGLPLAGAWQIAGQIADALAAAHERGIVHRDLKPANVIVKSDGTVKVLDFGLAKPFESASIDAMNSPTLANATEAGLILGTAAYMSPEQARGRPVDERCDIWAFGVVLYEMLTGRSCFGKETVSDTVAAVLTSDTDWTRVPPPARRLLTLCLEKDPKRRLRAIADAQFMIGDGRAEATPAPTRRTWIPWAAAGVLAAALGASLALPRPQRDTRPLIRFDLDLGGEVPDRALGALAFSPDGTRIAVPVRGPDGRPALSTRRVDQSDSALLQGTEGADQPFFSTDGQWIAFFADGKLKKVPVQGGTSVDIADVRNPRGGSWAEDGTIIAALVNTSGLSQVPGDGGPPQPLTTLKDGELTHRWPQVLPGNSVVLFTAHSGTINSYENASIVVLSRADGVRKTVWRGGYHGRFIPTDGKRGHLVFVHRGALHAVRFDADQLEVEGTPVPLVQALASDPESAAGRFDFSRSGMFAFRTGVGVQAWTVGRLDGGGSVAPLLSKPAMYYSPRFSPDGRRLAVAIDAGKGMDIVVHDFERDMTSPITFNAETNADPVWTSDGAHFVFRSLTANGWQLWWIRADGAGGPQPLLANAGEVGDLTANAMSHDNRRLIYARMDPATAGDLWILPVDPSDPDRPKAGQPELFLRTPANETRPAFSPDGRWVAYNSNESGTVEVYVRAAASSSSAGGKWQISSGGGGTPVWSRAAREIYFPRAGQIMVSDYIVRGSSFEAGKPRLWSKQRLFQTAFTNFDLAPDGKQFAIVPDSSASPPEVRVTMLLNFFDELRRHVP
jgi:Tol biopolymer transport system component/tRNA A-37 threonylcarbamoyl transferase component Bud32